MKFWNCAKVIYADCTLFAQFRRILFALLAMASFFLQGELLPMNNGEEVAAWLQGTSSECRVVLKDTGLEILCSNGSLSEDGSSFSIVLTDVAFPSKWSILKEELHSSMPETLEIRLCKPEWEGLPIPLDLVAHAVLKELADCPPRRLHILLPAGAWWRNLATLWNLRAVVGLFSGKMQDLRLARGQFLQEIAGGCAEDIREYFRIGERVFLTATALAGIGDRRQEPLPQVVFSQEKLAKLAAMLEQASSHDNGCVRIEATAFAQTCKRLSQAREATLRVISPETGKQFLTGVNGGWVSVQSTVEISVDEKRLWVRLEGEEPEMSTRKRNCKLRDEPTWKDDCFEIYLLADGTEFPVEGWQFVVNCNGAIWDARLLKVRQERGWNAPGAHAEVVENANGWTVLFSVPWSDLGVDAPPQGRWRANFYRTRHAGGSSEAMAWSLPEDGQYYSPKDFGWIEW